ncbi:hypothetical protein GCM10010399_87360 [Dactylosporangium fulvum]|uniref:Phosphotransferase n=1 Tax=Dactylosporangium fulvum TaxID=53359 RepID=A0ABY5VRP1_9ACTN|nr:phosphotransferase [Dactylosporangium fulvum]UWP79153.1 phosphotransferase [Dactylosporangium fulvum]
MIDADLHTEAHAVLGDGAVRATRLAHSTRTGVTAGVWRVEVGGATAIAKVVSPGVDRADWRGSHDPRNYRYWRREPLVYDAGLPEAYVTAGVELPERLGSFHRADGTVGLWLRDVSGDGGSGWSVGRTREHARRLGIAQGRCALDRSWLDGPVPYSDGMLRDYLDTPEATSPDIEWERLEDAAAWRTPLMRAHFDDALREAVLRLCRERYDLVALGGHLPTTLCHHDLWPNNLFERDGRTVAIDWAFAGAGWIGGDIGNFVSDTALDLLRPSAELPALDAAVFAGYVDGLRESGWTGDPGEVRLGMCLLAAKWTWLVPVMLKRAAGDDHEVYGGRAADPDKLYRERAEVFRMLVSWAAEARTLTGRR